MEKKRKAGSISAVVRNLIESSDCGSRSAVDQLIALAESDTEIHHVLLKFGAEQAVRDYYHVQRRSFNSAPPTLKERNPVKDAERSEQKRKRRLFWDRYALFGHVQLKSATRPDLDASIKNR